MKMLRYLLWKYTLSDYLGPSESLLISDDTHLLNGFEYPIDVKSPCTLTAPPASPAATTPPPLKSCRSIDKSLENMKKITSLCLLHYYVIRDKLKPLHENLP